MESILTSIKKLLGITTDYEHFDMDLVIHINSVFSIITQLGVGPSTGFSIKDELTLWEEFLPEGQQLEMVKTYMYLKTKLVFDTSTTSAATLEAMKQTINELEWRINVAAESIPTSKEGDEE